MLRFCKYSCCWFLTQGLRTREQEDTVSSHLLLKVCERHVCFVQLYVSSQLKEKKEETTFPLKIMKVTSFISLHVYCFVKGCMNFQDPEVSKIKKS